jgi:hypothetical protein
MRVHEAALRKIQLIDPMLESEQDIREFYKRI